MLNRLRLKLAAIALAMLFVPLAGFSQGADSEARQALPLIRQAAARGDADAQATLGFFYAKGLGVDQDLEQAFFWFKKAAEQGQSSAQSMLGAMYDFGQGGVRRDINEAVYWYIQSGSLTASERLNRLMADGQISGTLKEAVQGKAEAQFRLGERYHTGDGVTRNASRALFWYKRAADQEYPFALYSLGLMYENGEGGRQNAQAALSLFQRAARMGHEKAKERVAPFEAPKERDVLKDMLRAAEQGDDKAQLKIGEQYARGRIDGHANMKKAAYWYQKAAEQGNAEA